MGSTENLLQSELPGFEEGLSAELARLEIPQTSQIKQLISENIGVLQSISPDKKSDFLTLCRCVSTKSQDSVDIKDIDLSGLNLNSLSRIELSFDGVNLSDSILEDCLTKHSFRNCKFSGVDFSGANLAKKIMFGCDFKGSNVTGPQLTKARGLSKCNFTGLDLTGLNLKRHRISSCTFDNTNITWDQLSRAKTFKNCSLSGVDLSAADFVGKDISGTDFANTNVSWQQLEQASDLRGCVFNGVDFTGANLEGKDLKGADFSNSNITWSQLSTAKNIENCKFFGVNFIGGDLSGHSLRGCDFRGAHVQADQLIKAKDITQCNFNGVDFAGVDLSQADVSGSNFVGAKNITGSQLLESKSMDGCKIERLDFTGATFANKEIASCDFTQVLNLSGTQISEAARLVDCKLGNVDFGGLEFSAEYMAGCDFSEATNLSGTQLQAVKDITGCNFSGIDFTDADLTGKDLYGCNFSNTNIAWHQVEAAKRLSSCNFSGLDFHGQTIRDHDLQGCRFDGTKLKDATFINCELEEATFKEITPEVKASLKFNESNPLHDAYQAMVQSIYESHPSVIEKITVQDLQKIAGGDLGCLNEALSDVEELHDSVNQTICAYSYEAWKPESQALFNTTLNTINSIFDGHNLSKEVLLEFTLDTFTHPDQALQQLSEESIKKFENLYWQKGRSGQRIDEKALEAGQGRGEPVIFSLIKQVSKSNYTDLTLDNKYNCLNYILNNFNAEADISHFISGNNDDLLAIPTNAFSSFQKCLEAVRVADINRNDPDYRALFNQISEESIEASNFFRGLSQDPLANKAVVKGAMEAYVNNDINFWNQGRNDTELSPVNNAHYFDISPEGTRPFMDSSELMQGLSRGWFDKNQAFQPFHLQETHWFGIKENDQTALASLTKELEQWSTESFYNWVLSPKTAMPSEARQVFGNDLNAVFKSIQDECISALIPEGILKNALESATYQDKLRQSGTLIPEQADADAVLAVLKGRASYSYLTRLALGRALTYQELSEEQVAFLEHKMAEVQSEMNSRVYQTLAKKGAEEQIVHFRLVPPSNSLSHSKGSHTSSCDSLGNENVNFYNTSSQCASVVVSVENKSTGQEEVFCQSTLTLNKQGMHQFWKENQQLGNLDSEFLAKFMLSPYVLVYDNIEVNGALSKKFYQAMVSNFYQKMNDELLKEYPGAEVQIGLVFSKYFQNLEAHKANSGCLNKLPYSDATKVGLLREGSASQDALLTNIMTSLKNSATKLGSQWTIPVAYMQRKTYQEIDQSGQTNLTESASEIQNTIIAAECAWECYFQKNNIEDGQNPSTIVFDEIGVPAGYLIAYPIKLEDDLSDSFKADDTLIYVHDIAVSSESRSNFAHALRLCERLFETSSHFNEPILADVRNSTSYPLIKAYEKLGRISIEEIEDLGDDITRVIIRSPTTANH